MRRIVFRVIRGEQGVAMVEATFGVVFLLFVSLAAIQLALVLHGSLAARAGAMRAARAYALHNDAAQASEVFALEVGMTLGHLVPHDPSCVRNGNASGGMATCTGAVTIPTVLPGIGLFGDGGISGDLTVTATGSYPFRT